MQISSSPCGVDFAASVAAAWGGKSDRESERGMKKRMPREWEEWSWGKRGRARQPLSLLLLFSCSRGNSRRCCDAGSYVDAFGQCACALLTSIWLPACTRPLPITFSLALACNPRSIADVSGWTIAGEGNALAVGTRKLTPGNEWKWKWETKTQAQAKKITQNEVFQQRKMQLLRSRLGLNT